MAKSAFGLSFRVVFLCCLHSNKPKGQPRGLWLRRQPTGCKKTTTARLTLKDCLPKSCLKGPRWSLKMSYGQSRVVRLRIQSLPLLVNLLTVSFFQINVLLSFEIKRCLRLEKIPGGPRQKKILKIPVEIRESLDENFSFRILGNLPNKGSRMKQGRSRDSQA